MNTEILKGLKEYVFALYYGQDVMRWINPQPPEHSEFTETITGSMLDAYSHECYLALRALSSITDSELKQVVALALSFPNTNEDELIGIDEVFIDNIDKLEVEIRFDISVRCWEGRFIINHLNGNLYTVNEEDDSEGLFNTLAVYQYLKQKGFALPVYYNGQLFSVAVLEQMQIIKTV